MTQYTTASRSKPGILLSLIVAEVKSAARCPSRPQVKRVRSRTFLSKPAPPCRNTSLLVILHVTECATAWVSGMHLLRRVPYIFIFLLGALIKILTYRGPRSLMGR